MARPYLSYPLQRGYIHNWLVAGPHATPVENLDRFPAKGRDEFKSQVAPHYYEETSGINAEPVDRDSFTLDETELRWVNYTCLDDHFVDLSRFYHACHFLRAWAYAVVYSPVEQTVEATLTSNGPADLWLDGVHQHRQDRFSHQRPYSQTTLLTFKEGFNPLLIRFEAVATRECPYVMALHLADFQTDQNGTDVLPTRLPSATEAVSRYHNFQTMFEQAYIDRDILVSRDDVLVRWPKDLTIQQAFAARLQTPAGRIYAESERQTAKPGGTRTLGKANQVPEGGYEIFLFPDPSEYYEHKMRPQRRIPIQLARNAYSTETYDTYQERRLEALRDAAMRRSNIYSEIARMAMGLWTDIKTDAILEAIDGISRRQDCSDFYLIGLLGILDRYSDQPDFPQDILQPLEECILNFKYWSDEPGQDAMAFGSENHQILFHTCEILAGQRYPDRIFSNNGQNGDWHRQHGEELALAWLKQRARYGFQEWDSNVYFEHDLLALSHLLDLAENQTIWELAAVIIDKILLTIALNSFKGVFGSTHGRTYTPYIKGGYLEATSGICRLMWGLGTFNRHLLGTVAMACTENYQLPAIIANLATNLPEEMWSKERHQTRHQADGQITDINKVTYKTPDYMLCSAQDYRPGEPGYQQHIWQATLGPDAVVFVTHPPCLGEDGSHRPGAWHGNLTLPRVAQWHDVLIAVHNLPEDDWLGFTHGYFPTGAFDEHAIHDSWAFARKGDGYLALTAAQGIEFITHGNNAYREIRSHGHRNIWLCQMGRRALDDSFANFQQRVLAANLTFDDLSASYTSLRGETIAFGWTGPFLVNSEAQPLDNFKHYDGPFAAAEWPATILAMGYEKELLRLNLEVEAPEAAG